MINIFHILLIVWFHYIADFICQNDYMARNKSKDNVPLQIHCWVYGSVLILPSLFIFENLIAVFFFCCGNAYLHFGIDYLTSRLARKKYETNQMGSKTIPNFGFFSVIGLDQALHYTCLFLTYAVLINLKV